MSRTSFRIAGDCTPSEGGFETGSSSFLSPISFYHWTNSRLSLAALPVPRGRSLNHAPSTHRQRSKVARGRTAFTLLEVILSLVILGAALAMLGEIMRLANRNAVDARAETQAQMLAESLMDEILAGSIDPSDAARQSLEVDDATPWVYSITIGTSDVEGILPVEVTVEQDLEPRYNPVKFRLLRWMPTYPEMPEMGGGAGGPGGQAGGAAAPGQGGGQQL
jgi:type II secretory pathway pseudopilin PulG